MFYNELDILEIRLYELYDVVDYFILVEATGTHNGNKPKPLYFQENKSRYAKYLDKIIHITINYMENFDYMKNLPKTSTDHWYREHYQRECIRQGLLQLNLNDNDLLIVSDTDEIVKRSIITDIRTDKLKITDDLYNLELTLYYYNIEYTRSTKWYQAKLIKYSRTKTNESLTKIRYKKHAPCIKDAGYHLSYFGDVDFIQNKIESFAESIEYSEKGKSKEYLKECYDKKILHFNNKKLIYIPLSTNNNVPQYFLICNS